MQYTPYNSQLLVNLSAIQQNYRYLADSFGKSTSIVPVLKCNAYGIGATAVAKALLQTNAALPMVAVSQVQEAAALYKEGISTPVLLLGGLPQKNIECAVSLGLHLTVYNSQIATAINQEALRQNKTQYPVQIKIDTGLNRIGAKPGMELEELAKTLLRCNNLAVNGAYTHFMNGEKKDSPTSLHQAELFRKGIAQLENLGINTPMQHICASGSSEWMGNGECNTMRIGRRLFMDAPLLPGCAPPEGNIQECCSWRSQIVSIRHLSAGESIGYGGHFTTPTPMDIAVVCVGYGDGLPPQLAKNGAPVLVKEQTTRLLDTAMDQCFIDVTGLNSQIGDEVTFFGYSSGGAFLSSQKVAAFIQDEGVYLTSLLSNRVERVYYYE